MLNLEMFITAFSYIKGNLFQLIFTMTKSVTKYIHSLRPMEQKLRNK